MIVSKHSVLINTKPRKLLNVLLDHNNLSAYFDAGFSIIQPESPGELPGGRGCIRQVCAFGVRFNEQITNATLKGINYNVVGNFPMKNHNGKIVFENKNGQTWLTYKISCEPLWFTPRVLIKYILDKQILTAFKNLRAAF